MIIKFDDFVVVQIAQYGCFEDFVCRNVHGTMKTIVKTTTKSMIYLNI